FRGLLQVASTSPLVTTAGGDIVTPRIEPDQAVLSAVVCFCVCVSDPVQPLAAIGRIRFAQQPNRNSRNRMPGAVDNPGANTSGWSQLHYNVFRRLTGGYKHHLDP